jgi:hypothetical protein
MIVLAIIAVLAVTVFWAIRRDIGDAPHGWRGAVGVSAATNDHVVRPSLNALACSVSAGTPHRLVVGQGDQLYVEAVAHASSGPNVLLAGTPNYLWRRSSSAVRRNEVFGAVILPDGTAKAIRSPIEVNRLSGIRASGRGDGSWDVVFAQLKFPRLTHLDDNDDVDRLWYGVYEGAEWKTVEEIPLPPGGMRLQASRSSELVRRGDTLTWAVRARMPSFYTDVVVFERRGGVWTSEIVPTRRASYVAITSTAPFGAVLAVVGVDTTMRTDGNSMFLWTRAPVWAMNRRVVLGSRDGPVHHPTLVTRGNRTFLTWLSAGGQSAEVRSLLDPLTSAPVAAATVDSEYTAMKPVESVSLNGGDQIWITDHEAADSKREIRFLVARESAPQSLGAVPNPFLRSFRAARVSDSEVLLTGTLIDSLHNRPVSLHQRVRIACSAAAPPP